MNDFRARWTPRERVVLLVLGLYLTVVLIALSPVRGAIGGDVDTALPPPPSGASADPQPAAAGAPVELAANQAQRAREIIGDDRALASVLGATSHTVVKSGPWTTTGADGSESRVLGAAFVIAPGKPVDLASVELPGALYDQSERTRTPYQSVVNRVSAKQVKQLLVLVDLERGRVVNITPGPGSQDLTSAPAPGFRRTVPMPVEGGR